VSLAFVADSCQISVSDSTEYDVMLKSGNNCSIPTDITSGKKNSVHKNVSFPVILVPVGPAN